MLRAHWHAAVAEVVAWMPGRWHGRAGLVRRAARLAVAAAPGARRQPDAWSSRTRAGASCAPRPRRRARRRCWPTGRWRALAAGLVRARHAGCGLAGRMAAPPAAAAARCRRQPAPGAWRRCGGTAPRSPRRPRRARAARIARVRCRRGLSLLLRRATLEPAAAFIHLALSALELERLRGELLVRKLFRERQGGLMLRPRPTRWFEILAARDDATLVLEALARTGAVELEARSGAALPADPAEVMPLLATFIELSARYRAYWPEPRQCRPSAFPEAPAADTAALPGHDPCLGRGRRAGDPRAAARRGRARELQLLAARARRAGAKARARSSAIWPAPGRWWPCVCSCCPPAPSPPACCRRPRRGWSC